MCEAFLHIKPHFGLWLKTFNVKPKVVVSQQAECIGAMVGKMPNVTWLEGSYVETIKGWQSGWFYITEPRDTNWVAAPEFGLWLKTFNVKPKVVVSQQAECIGAMVGKMPNVTWLEGSYVETIKGWQSGWFYITEPRDTNWVAAPEF